VLASFIVVHCLLLVIVRSRVGFEVIDVRLLFPALVCLTVVTFGTLGRRVAGAPGFAVAVVWIAASFTATMLDTSSDPTAGSLSSDRERNQPVIRWAERSLASQLPPRTLIFADDVCGIHFATGRPVLSLPPVSNFDAVDASRSSTDLLFIVGPPGPRSSLTTGAEREAYERALSKVGAQVLGEKATAPGVFQALGSQEPESLQAIGPER
jgi:hypothetical protein